MSSIDLEKPFAAEGYAVMGAAFEVHREIGGGLAEEVYQKSLEIEFELQSVPFEPKRRLSVYYKARKLETSYTPDFVTHARIVVELKAAGKITRDHEAQLLNYMRIARQPVGYLINLAPLTNIEWKRFVLSEFVSNR